MIQIWEKITLRYAAGDKMLVVHWWDKVSYKIKLDNITN